ncbi:MAG: gluconate 2-dehydrogenase subunit 3 family protein [Ginsengibacter sp.]
MNRRQSLKAIGISTISTGILLEACKTGLDKSSGTIVKEGGFGDADTTGLQDFEKERLKELNKQASFFNDHERLTLIALGDLIIPKDEISGSASDANVIDFLDFIVKDIPEHQIPLRGGLKWLDMQCLTRYGHSFLGTTENQKVEMLEEIAYPMKVKPEMHQGAIFFDRLRNLVATGFYTSKIGINDLGYVGNVPGKWDGVPAEVLAQYNLKPVNYGV